MNSEPVQQFHELSADAAIWKFRRSTGYARAVWWMMLIAGVLLLSLSARFSITPFLACAVFVPWIAMEWLSARSNRLNRDATSLIEIGALDAAEEKASEALKRFSLHRIAKLTSLHQLAAIRHAQRRFADASKLAREVASDVRVRDQRLDRSTRLVLVDSLIELNDLDNAQVELARLLNESLSLRELLGARQLQVDLLGRRAAWRELVDGLQPLTDLAELMQPLPSARTHAWLALAARYCGLSQTSDFLRQRSELLAEVEEVVNNRPLLWRLWNRSSSPPPLPEKST